MFTNASKCILLPMNTDHEWLKLDLKNKIECKSED